MIYIEDLHEGERISQIYLCKQKVTGITKAGKSYYSLKLQDKTGVCDGKVWELNNSIEHFEAMDYIRIEADVQNYNGSIQLKIYRIRKADPGEYDQKDYMPVSQFGVDEMFAELKKYMDKVQNPYLKQLLNSFFEDEAFVESWKMHSAAKSVHHSFMGGLLQHTLRVTQLCYFLSLQYPIMNRDLLLTAAIFHDVGKVKELSDFPENDYTDEGQLLGHIVMGYQMLKEKIDQIEGFPKKLETELLHCILSHHGELEYGSPKLPSLIEACALAHADDTDAKLDIFAEEFEKTASTDFLGVNRFLGTNIRKTSKD